MRPGMETSHKDLYNGLWDSPESFHMEAKTYKVFLNNPEKHDPYPFLDLRSVLGQKCHGRLGGPSEYFPYTSSFLCQVLYEASFLMILGPTQKPKIQINLA